MVVTETVDGEDVYRCEVCGYHYRDRETAERCERFCREHDGCSTTISAESLERTDEI